MYNQSTNLLVARPARSLDYTSGSPRGALSSVPRGNPQVGGTAHDRQGHDPGCQRHAGGPEAAGGQPHHGGYRASPAETGERALAVVAAYPPELILLDVGGAGLYGLDVCRRLKARDETRDIPVVFMSASGEGPERAEASSLEAADFLSKPIRHEELLARVRTQLELRRLRLRLEEQPDELRSQPATPARAGRVGEPCGPPPVARPGRRRAACIRASDRTDHQRDTRQGLLEGPRPRLPGLQRSLRARRGMCRAEGRRREGRLSAAVARSGGLVS